MKWKDKALRFLVNELKNDPKSKELYERINNGYGKVGIHLAVFSEPFVSLLLEGQKKIESRFSINRVNPYGKVAKGDIILIKKTGGPIVGFFLAGSVEYHLNINKNVLKKIATDYSDLICANAEPDFWKVRERSNYITLVEVKKVKKTEPYSIAKRDRTAWVVIKENGISSFDF